MGQEIQEAEEIMKTLIVIGIIFLGVPLVFAVLLLFLYLWVMMIDFIRNPRKFIDEIRE